jgi:hypothetical protein
VQAKAVIALNGKIQNPVGFLLTAVPKCFEGSAFAAYREEENRRKEEERRTDSSENEKGRNSWRQGFHFVLPSSVSSLPCSSS